MQEQKRLVPHLELVHASSRDCRATLARTNSRRCRPVVAPPPGSAASASEQSRRTRICAPPCANRTRRTSRRGAWRSRPRGSPSSATPHTNQDPCNARTVASPQLFYDTTSVMPTNVSVRTETNFIISNNGRNGNGFRRSVLPIPESATDRQQKRSVLVTNAALCTLHKIVSIRIR